MGAALLVFNPLLAVAFSLTFHGFSHFLVYWAVTLTVTNAMTLECFALISVIQVTAKYVTKRGLPRLWAFVVSVAAMPVTLPIAYRAGGMTSAALGYPWSGGDLQEYRIGLAFGAVVALVYFLQILRAETRETALIAKEKIQALENAQLKAQINALTFEMNPHLLFNALNTVASLIHDDPGRAEEVVVELASLYRGVLQSTRASQHALRDELNLCQAYLRIEQARFGDRIQARITCAPGVDDRANVPVLLLQPLVENAVRHGIGPRARGGTVTLYAVQEGESLRLSVTDDGVGMGASPYRGTGRALDNVQERLALLFEGRAAMQIESSPEAGTTVTLVLPVHIA